MATPPKQLANAVSAAPPTDLAQDALVRALRASFNILRVLMVILVVLYVFSGVFRVNPEDQGLVARFGKLRPNPAAEGGRNVFGPGWYPALPDPFDQKYVLTGRVQTLKVTTFMFSHAEAATAKDLAAIVGYGKELQPGVDGAMYSGDKNLSHGRWEVQYAIEDAAKFVEHCGQDPNAFAGGLLTRLTETAVVREIAGRTVEEVTRTALDDVSSSVQRRLQAALDGLNTGVRVATVVAYTIEPGQVREAFIDVGRAESERDTLASQADEKAKEALNRAAGPYHRALLELIRDYGAAQLTGADDSALSQKLTVIDDKLTEAEAHEAGEVAVRLRNARAQANETNDDLRRQYEEFTKLLEQRAAQPRITVLGLWSQMREEILGDRNNEIFFVPRSDIIEIIVNRDPQRQRELEEQQTLKRQQGGQ